MSDGAKTGTPREWKLIIDMESGMVADYFGPDMELGDRPTNEILVREVLDNDPLTEALNVAGEALAVAIVQLYDSHKEDCLAAFSLDQLQWASDTSEPLRDRTVEAIYLESLAALERIRNQSLL